MKRSFRALAGALVVGGGSVFGVAPGIAGEARAGAAQPAVAECVNFHDDVQEKSILVRAKNACDRRLSCTLRYEVRCEDNSEHRRTSSNAESARFTLASEGSTELVLSAERCPQAWTIDQVNWQCQDSHS